MALYGDLGSGKTTFTKGLAKALGITSQISSPTFVVLKEYKIEKKELIRNNNIEKLVHVDCYRFGSYEDAYSIGLPEYFEQKNILLVIEWPEKIEKILPTRTKKIIFSYLDERQRKVSYEED